MGKRKDEQAAEHKELFSSMAAARETLAKANIKPPTDAQVEAIATEQILQDPEIRAAVEELGSDFSAPLQLNLRF